MATSTRTVSEVLHPGELHWVGDGFPVTSLFSPGEDPGRLSPFLLLDYGGPRNFEPTWKRRGVGTHPHRGFETVTIVYAGEVEHRDSTGASGTIGPGDVQWMTAGAGVLHEEMHSDRLTREGGVLEMVQLWVNLPARHKRTAPRYQTLLGAAIPRVSLEDGAGSARVIAGELRGTQGAAATMSPVQVWDVELAAGSATVLDVPDGHTAAILVRRGALEAGGQSAGVRDLVVFGRSGRGLGLRAQSDAELLVIAGEPIAEPVAAYGPFVMNTEDEIRQAISDLRSGTFA
jgi:hypothetical protein